MRASRVLSMLLLLQRRGRLSASALAGLLEVSVRTVHRDIEQLSAAGVPVYAVRGRAGGFELLGGWQTHLTGLTAPEAEALSPAGLRGPAEALGLGPQLDAAELKLMAALPDLADADPLRVRTRFHLDATNWFATDDAVPFLELIGRAARNDERVRIRYESWTEVTDRVIGPLGLVLKAGGWYVVALSRGHPRTFRLAKVLGADATGEHFERPPDFDLARFWMDHAAAYERSRFSTTATIRVSRIGLELLRRTTNVVAEALGGARIETDAAGWSTVTVPIESIDHAADEMIKLGPHVEVVEPPELRHRVMSLVGQLASIYGLDVDVDVDPSRSLVAAGTGS